MRRAITAPFHIPVKAYRRQLLSLVRQALDEDIGQGDLTVEAMDLGRQTGEAVLVAKSPGVLAGADAFEATFRFLDRKCRFEWSVEEGARFHAGRTVARIQGRASTLLTAERTAINFVAHLSGVATATRHLVDLIPKGRTRLLDTRKTTPGWRYLEKRATVIGGAVNHRLGLHDALMVKDNHVGAVGDFKETVWRALKAARGRQLICEIHALSHVQDALMIGASWLLLDNFPAARLRRAVMLIRQFERRLKCRLIAEASGNVSEKIIAAIARCGPDYISSGSITHSAPAVDFSMKWVS
jgi:nicotinate-nucleotide pyrophosphorylase (carboxylating)